MPIAESFLARLERFAALDALSERLARVVRAVVRPGPVEDVLSGTPLGHPLHPAIVAVPIGALVSANLLDVLDDPAAGTVQAVGLLSALPASLSGAADWQSTAGAERRVATVHAGLNYAALALHVASWRYRRRDRRAQAKALAYAGTGLLGVAGWLGGHLTYALGVGVDMTAFQQLPADWVDAIAEQDVPVAGSAYRDVEGVPVLFARWNGSVVAYADRCTHRGAPLHEGEVSDGCVTCPWHGSALRPRGRLGALRLRPRGRSRHSRSWSTGTASSSAASRNGRCGRIRPVTDAALRWDGKDAPRGASRRPERVARIRAAGVLDGQSSARTQSRGSQRPRPLRPDPHRRGLRRPQARRAGRTRSSAGTRRGAASRSSPGARSSASCSAWRCCATCPPRRRSGRTRHR